MLGMYEAAGTCLEKVADTAVALASLALYGALSTPLIQTLSHREGAEAMLDQGLSNDEETAY